MIVLTCIVLGFFVASLGSISPSFLNLTVVKFSLRNGTKSAFFLIGGFATVLFLQANIGAYLANVLMENSQYISLIQKIGTVILLALSVHFFRLHFTKNKTLKKQELDPSKAYLHGLGMSLLNTFAIPFYFTSISFLIGLAYFKYSMTNSFYFSIGSTLGSFTVYASYAVIANKIEDKLTKIATKMDLILGCLTGLVGLGNVVYFIISK